MLHLESKGAQVVSVVDDDILGICVASDAILQSILQTVDFDSHHWCRVALHVRLSLVGESVAGEISSIVAFAKVLEAQRVWLCSVRVHLTTSDIRRVFNHWLVDGKVRHCLQVRFAKDANWCPINNLIQTQVDAWTCRIPPVGSHIATGQILCESSVANEVRIELVVRLVIALPLVQN